MSAARNIQTVEFLTALTPRKPSVHHAEDILKPSDSEKEMNLHHGLANAFAFVASQYTGPPESPPIIPDVPSRQRFNIGSDTIDPSNSPASLDSRPGAKRVVMSDFGSSSDEDWSSADPVSPPLSVASIDELTMPQQKGKSTKRPQKVIVLDGEEESDESPVRLYAPRKLQKMDQSKNTGVANRKQASQAAVTPHAVGVGSPRKK